jgi:hypothetical protein
MAQTAWRYFSGLNAVQSVSVGNLFEANLSAYLMLTSLTSRPDLLGNQS